MILSSYHHSSKVTFSKQVQKPAVPDEDTFMSPSDKITSASFVGGIANFEDGENTILDLEVNLEKKTAFPAVLDF